MPRRLSAQLKPKTSADAPTARLKYAPSGPTMHQFHTRTDFVRLVVGPLWSGKTFGAINQLLREIHDQAPDKDNTRRSRWCVARNNYSDLFTSTIPDMLEVFDGLPGFSFSKGSAGEPPTATMEYGRLDGTKVQAVIWFRSFDSPGDVKKARGMNLTGVLIDEVGEFNKANFDMLIGRVKRYPVVREVPDAKYAVLGISNAVPRDHWLYELVADTPDNWWIGVQPGGVVKEHGQWVENPQRENRRNLAPNYYTDQLGGKKESWIRQNLANEFVHHADGRPIHPDFAEHIHVKACKATPGLPLTLGMDWGRTPACLIGQRQVSGQWRILKEICLENAGSDKLGARVKTVLAHEFPGFTVESATGDPAGVPGTQASDESAFDLFMENSGLEAYPAETNDPETRYNALDEKLTALIGGEPAIIFDPSCELTIAGLAGQYCFRRIQVAGEERYRDNPDKGPTSHPVESCHYLLLGAGEGYASVSMSDAEYDGYDWAPAASHFE